MIKNNDIRLHPWVDITVHRDRSRLTFFKRNRLFLTCWNRKVLLFVIEEPKIGVVPNCIWIGDLLRIPGLGNDDMWFKTT